MHMYLDESPVFITTYYYGTGLGAGNRFWKTEIITVIKAIPLVEIKGTAPTVL